MNISTTITGLLMAAVLSVPGTTRHDATPVEEEPVVEVSINKIMAQDWLDLHFDNPSNQLVVGIINGSPADPCDETTGTVCAVSVTYDPMDDDIAELLDRIDEGIDYPTLDEFNAAGATIGPYTRKP